MVRGGDWDTGGHGEGNRKSGEATGDEWETRGRRGKWEDREATRTVGGQGVHRLRLFEDTAHWEWDSLVVGVSLTPLPIVSRLD
jgi:hypothetical protein